MTIRTDRPEVTTDTVLRPPSASTEPRRVNARLSPGRRIYAIGDVHGCLDPLMKLHGLIAADLASRPIARPLLIHLGDLIDRGPDSAGVLNHLASLRIPGLREIVNLSGNHEQMALAAFDQGSEAVDLWLRNGGRATLASFGIREADPPSSWSRRVPHGAMALLRGLKLCERQDEYFFVHAGIRPERPLDQQSEHDMLWIRQPFLSHAGALPAVVVHGHTPHPTPEVTRWRIGIDTGAVAGGWLTCAVLEGSELRFLQA